MATRQLSDKFYQLRQVYKGTLRASKSHLVGEAPLLSEISDSTAPLGEIPASLAISLPPEWVDIVEGIQRDIKDIKAKMKALETMHSARLRVGFGNEEQKQEREIEIVSAQISQLFHNCESGLKRIATVGNARGHYLPPQERVVRLNVMRGLAQELQSLSKQFRHQQKDFVLRLKSQNESLGDTWMGDTENKQMLSFTEALDRGFTEENMARLEELEQHASDREREIIRVAQSINELAQIFRELNVLVIEQGTIVDRIDYNVEQTLQTVRTGNVHLKKADDASKKARSLWCIVILSIIVIILVSILIYKKSDEDSKEKK